VRGAGKGGALCIQEKTVGKLEKRTSRIDLNAEAITITCMVGAARWRGLGRGGGVALLVQATGGWICSTTKGMLCYPKGVRRDERPYLDYARGSLGENRGGRWGGNCNAIVIWDGKNLACGHVDLKKGGYC